MVRFARAEGSKGSNKKQLEEPTPWGEMVSQLPRNKMKRKKHQEEAESGTVGESPGRATKKRKNTATEKPETTPPNFSQTPEDQTTNERNEGHPMQTVKSNDNKNQKGNKKGPKTSKPDYIINSEGKRVKVFRDGTERTWFDLPYTESDTMTRYDGMWVKRAMVGELDRLKTALEDEGLDNKGIMRKMMKAKRKAHRDLRIELIYQQKSVVSEAAGGNGESNFVKNRVNGKQKKKQKKQKLREIGTDTGLEFSANTKNSMQINENYHNQIDEQSTMMMNIEEEMHEDNDGDEDNEQLQHSDNVQKNKKINYIDSNIKKENTMEVDRLEMTPSWINKNDHQEVEDNKIILATQDDTVPSQVKREDNDDEKEPIEKPKSKSKKKKRKEEEIATEALITQVKPEHYDKDDNVTVTPHADDKRKMNDNKFETDETESQIDKQHNNETENIASSTNQEETYDFNKLDHISSHQGGFEENELMTNYDGYWVLRKDVETLDGLKEMELEIIYGARTDGSKGELSEKEKILLQRAVKKRKRFYHKKLLQIVSKTGRKNENYDREEKRSPKKEADSGKVVKFDGYFVKEDAAERLHKLRSKLFKEGLSHQEVEKLILKERRKEERVLKNERKLVCLNCRQPGHMVSACPSIADANGECLPSICYTCGSTEHTSATCNLKKESESSFSFATCFICKETGHISRQCPDNPRGLYPKGGACRGCGSVEHLAKDCPDIQKENAESTIKVGRMKGEELEALDEDADADEAADQELSTSSKLNKPKVVKF